VTTPLPKVRGFTGQACKRIFRGLLWSYTKAVLPHSKLTINFCFVSDCFYALEASSDRVFSNSYCSFFAIVFP
jgi:hypothetical protein